MNERTGLFVAGGLVLAGLFVAAVLLWSSVLQQSQAQPTSAAVPPVAPPEPVRELTLAERVDAAPTLGEALELLVPLFQDTNDADDPATAKLAVWASKRLTWRELQARPETLHGLVMKDSTLARGKRLCASGKLVEIEVDRTTGTPIYVGALLDSEGLLHKFMAVHSTAGLISGTRARFCGVVTGRAFYTNSAGGQNRAAQVVGMFDKPENVSWRPERNGDQ